MLLPLQMFQNAFVWLIQKLLKFYTFLWLIALFMSGKFYYRFKVRHKQEYKNHPTGQTVLLI